MSDAANTVTVRILDKEYQVACPPDEVESLTASARFLDQRMAQIRNSGKVVGLDRIAVMAALNITHDYLSEESVHNESRDSVNKRISQMSERVGSVLEQHNQPE